MQVNNNLQGFYSELTSNGVHLSHQFRLSIQDFYGTFPAGSESLISMFARGAQVPGVTQNVNDIKYLAYNFKVPSSMQFDQALTLTVLCDSDQKLRDGFVGWANKHSSLAIGRGANGGGLKKTPASNIAAYLTLLDEEFKNPKDTYKLIGIFPTKVGPMEHSHDNATPVTFTVEFAYQYWENKVTSTLSFNDTFFSTVQSNN